MLSVLFTERYFTGHSNVFSDVQGIWDFSVRATALLHSLIQCLSDEE